MRARAAQAVDAEVGAGDGARGGEQRGGDSDVVGAREEVDAADCAEGRVRREEEAGVGQVAAEAVEDGGVGDGGDDFDGEGAREGAGVG